jgi:uncharacterized membrane protein
VAAYAAGFSALSALRHRAFETGRFDLGNMVQAVWATAHGRPLEVTSLEGEQFVRLGAHFDPILVAFAPLWHLWPSPDLLTTAQAALVALGAVPLFRFARRRLWSEGAALGFALAYLLSPALQWMTLSEFHPVALATPLLLFALDALDEGRWGSLAVFALLALLTKEHVGLALAGLGVWHLAAGLPARRRPAAPTRRRLCFRTQALPGLLLVAAGLAAAGLAAGVVVPHFAPESSPGFGWRYDAVGGSPGGVLRTLVTDPGTIAAEALDGRGIAFLLRLVLPLAALPLAAPLLLVPALPELALNLLSSTPTQQSIRFHYAAVTLPFLAAAAVAGAARLARGSVRRGERLALLAVATSFVSTVALGPLPVWAGVPGGETLGAGRYSPGPQERAAARAVALVPDGVVVSATNSLGAHLSARERILSFPRLDDATWVAVDTTRLSVGDRLGEEPAFDVALAGLVSDPVWEVVFAERGVLVFRRGSSGAAGTP